jgi:hypothetical protein
MRKIYKRAKKAEVRRCAVSALIYKRRKAQKRGYSKREALAYLKAANNQYNADLQSCGFGYIGDEKWKGRR